jgi:hypothetical protein
MSMQMVDSTSELVELSTTRTTRTTSVRESLSFQRLLLSHHHLHHHCHVPWKTAWNVRAWKTTVDVVVLVRLATTWE